MVSIAPLSRESVWHGLSVALPNWKTLFLSMILCLVTSSLCWDSLFLTNLNMPLLVTNEQLVQLIIELGNDLRAKFDHLREETRNEVQAIKNEVKRQGVLWARVCCYFLLDIDCLQVLHDAALESWMQEWRRIYHRTVPVWAISPP